MPRRVKKVEAENSKNERTGENSKNERTGENSKNERTGENSKNERTGENSKVLKENILNMITNNFEPREMLAFSQLRTLNQKELIQSLDQNDKLGIVIKDKLQVAMINMEKYQMLVEAVHEYSRLLEWLEEQEMFKRIEHRLSDPVEWKELPEGKSLWEWAGLEAKG